MRVCLHIVQGSAVYKSFLFGIPADWLPKQFFRTFLQHLIFKLRNNKTNGILRAFIYQILFIIS
jgi:hypothetical protein